MNLNKLKKMAMVSAVAMAASGQAMAAAIDMDVATDQKLKYADEVKGALTDGKVAIAKIVAGEQLPLSKAPLI